MAGNVCREHFAARERGRLTLVAYRPDGAQLFAGWQHARLRRDRLLAGRNPP
jgi:hypothetical protein